MTDNPYAAGLVGGLVSNVVKQKLNIASGRACGFDTGDLAKDALIGLASGAVPEGEAGATGIAGQVEKGLPAAVGGGLADAAVRTVEKSKMHGRKGGEGRKEGGCVAPPPPDPCVINPLGCVQPLPL